MILISTTQLAGLGENFNTLCDWGPGHRSIFSLPLSADFRNKEFKDETKLVPCMQVSRLICVFGPPHPFAKVAH